MQSPICVLLVALVALLSVATAQQILVAAYSSKTCDTTPAITALTGSGVCNYSTDFTSYYSLTNQGGKSVSFNFGCAFSNCTKCVQNGTATYGECITLHGQNGVFASAYLVGSGSLSAGLYSDANCSKSLSSEDIDSGKCTKVGTGQDVTYAAVVDLSYKNRYLFEIGCGVGCSHCQAIISGVFGHCVEIPSALSPGWIKITENSSGGLPTWELAVIIAGGGAAVILCIAIVIVVIVVVMRRNRSDYHPVN